MDLESQYTMVILQTQPIEQPFQNLELENLAFLIKE